MKIIEIFTAMHPTYILNSHATHSNLPFFVLFHPNSASFHHKMFLTKSIIALACIAKVYSSRATEPAIPSASEPRSAAAGGHFDLSAAAEKLLIKKPKPTVADLDALVKGLVASSDVVSAGFIGGSDAASLDSMSASLGHEAIPASPFLRRAAINSAPGTFTDSDMVRIDIIPDEGAGVMLQEFPSASGSSVTGIAAPIVASTNAIRYIISNIAPIAEIVAALADINSKINAENYVNLINLFDKNFNAPLKALATRAITEIPQSDGSASRWKAILWELHVLVDGYVSQSKDIEDWAAFKAQLDTTLTRLNVYAMVARDRAAEPPPAAGTSNADLEQQLQVALVDTLCACFGECLFRICGRTGDGGPVPPAVPGDVVHAPDDALRKAIALTLFVESVALSIDGIVREIGSLQRATGPDADERIKNLKLRITLRVVNLLKQALVNNVVDKVYNAIQNKSISILGIMNGVTSASAWDSVKEEIVNSLIAIRDDLNASKPISIF